MQLRTMLFWRPCGEPDAEQNGGLITSPTGDNCEPEGGQNSHSIDLALAS